MLIEPRCSIRNCKHNVGAYSPNGHEIGQVPACDAFPKGIPDEIAYGDNLHLKPYPGDHGIQFEEAGPGEEV